MDKLDRMVALQKDHDELYWKGLVGVSGTGVHVTTGFLLAMSGKMQEKLRGADSAYPYEGFKKYAGVKFYALFESSPLTEDWVASEEREEMEQIMAEIGEMLA